MILEHVHPAFYPEVRKVLTKEEEKMIKEQQSFCFRTERCYVEKDAFIIEGEFLALVSKGGDTSHCSQKEKRKFTLQFYCQNGKLQLTSLKKEVL